jgi:hypothetical protein
LQIVTEHETTAAAATQEPDTTPDAHSALGTETANPEKLFTHDEIEQFDADDETAGGTIGKMLALFFLYTVIVMSVVAWWTANSVKGP